MAKKKKTDVKERETGSLSLNQVKNMFNKKAGYEVAKMLDEEDTIKEFISTGSEWLDRIIGGHRKGGIPVGRISEIAGLESTGKSFLATIIAGNAQKMKKPFNVVYFDAERTLDGPFARKANAGRILKDEPTTVEDVLEKIEMILSGSGQRYLFIWDSLAATPAQAELDGDFNPQSTIAVKSRVLSRGFPKITGLLKNTSSSLLIINQLKTNITTNFGEQFTEPYVTPGGKSPLYFYSLRVWLTKPKSKASFIEDDTGNIVGSTVKIRIKKSKLGSEGRRCVLQLLWGGVDTRICDEESWPEVLKMSDHFVQGRGAAHSTLIMGDGSEEKFSLKDFKEVVQKDEKIRARALQIMDEMLNERYKVAYKEDE